MIIITGTQLQAVARLIKQLRGVSVGEAAVTISSQVFGGAKLLFYFKLHMSRTPAYTIVTCKCKVTA